jgi:hypothetical protein
MWIAELVSPAVNDAGNHNSTHREFSEIQKGRQQERSSYSLLVNQEQLELGAPKEEKGAIARAGN